MGKTSLKTDCSPTSLRLVGAASVCKNSMYELVCNSIKLGGAMISLILPKLIRSVARDGILDLYWMAGHKTGRFFSTLDTRQVPCVQLRHPISAQQRTCPPPEPQRLLGFAVV